MPSSQGSSPAGKIISLLLILALVGTGFYVLRKKDAPSGNDNPRPAAAAAATNGEDSPAALVDTQRSVPVLAPAGPYVMKDNTVDVELSEYAGYAGLILANGGLKPTEDSLFFRNYGFKLRITIVEEDNWSGLNSGKFAASATTTDVLAVYGRQLQVTCPVLISYSRGADGIVVRSDVKRLNALTGKVTVAAQFNESDFFLRYLAQEAGIGVHMMDSLNETPAPDKINILYAEDAFQACDIMVDDMNGGGERIAACVTWAPKTTESVSESGGKARLLTTNRNLLIVSDILLMNKGFAQANPKVVAGLVEGLLDGNRRVRKDPAVAIPVLEAAFKWKPDECREELAKLHFANLPENEAYFSGAIDMAGSFGGIYQSAVLAYGSELLPDPAGYEKFIDPAPLAAARTSGKFSEDKISIQPISSGPAGSVENDPLLSKDIRFFFDPNSFTLVQSNALNEEGLAGIKRLLQVSPGSVLRLRGHVDNGNLAGFQKQGGDSFVRQMAMRAMKLSQDRANEVKRLLVDQLGVDASRIETVGRGWEEPAGPDPEKNRRVEVQWFTLE